MRISEIHGLNKSQGELDFIDVDLNSDLALFIDPHFLSNRKDSWSTEATRTIRSFFQNLVTLLATGNIAAAKDHFINLGEPNETCLGLSRGNPQGRGVGPQDTIKIFENIQSSKAMQSGLVDDLEDCVILVDNFAKDKLSDMTTNIIRMHLIEYTQSQCNLWGIPLTPNISSGSFWDRSRTIWDNTFTQMLVIDGKKYLLVPKSIVSFMKDYTPQKFHQHFALNFLQQEHLRLNTALVQRKYRKDGSFREFVTKESIKEQDSPGDKADLNNFVQKHPQIFKNFKLSMKKPSQSLADEAFVEINYPKVAKHLQTKLRELSPGNDQAGKYHNLIVGILEFLLYPELTCPIKECEIYEGRKRIDISFDNGANSGLFWELSRDMPCSYVFVECKNYNNDPKNPELDQLSGRFGPNTGKVGLLVCRSIEDSVTFYKRCSDTFKADRGLIIPITDEDLNHALQSVIDDDKQLLSEVLRAKCRQIRLN